MAVIERHPEVEDYIVEITLDEVRSRGGIADLFEEGRLVILKDYRLDFDFDALSQLETSTDAVSDLEMRRRLKKLVSTSFFEGEPPRKSWKKLTFADSFRQAIFDCLCRGEPRTFDRVSAALKSAHDQALRTFETCFPSYEPFRLIPSLRLTRTLFENLHWDNHSIDDDFHQARIFANLDSRPRIWNLSHRFPDWVRKFYLEHNLGRFAGKDPNLLIDYVTGKVFGGTQATWMDNQPRHRIAFDPGEVWLGESRLLSHQIVYGERAMVYMWFVRAASMADPENRFNASVERVHLEMQGSQSLASRAG
ncbi:hypothetical protein GCM10023264_03830 [Sphingomonas daechungensis]|uniref:DUF4942 domain-containing protein n=1 Tax=Sphingomonas daechungensis TaxID=1176646 RepID=A0ABX6SZS9_9SPHN|nr:hypothetical protein [Sphingomonas daechungensis]QNP42796.1 hypothetical protein H9L15_11980 [Sphingomonas daechungensis]